MATIATPAMRQFAAAWEAAIDGAAKRNDAATLSGIVGDLDHRESGGYHISREDQPASNYSVQLPEDRAGGSSWASAVDMSMSAEQMKLVTGRLLASAKDETDLRLNYVREFYGTLDGETVVGYDTYYGTPATSDDSHLWHVHISFLRAHADDPAAMAAVLSVITAAPRGDDMEQADKLAYPSNYADRRIGQAIADVSNLRDWLVGAAASPIAPGGKPAEPTSPLGKILAAAEKTTATPTAAEIAAEIIKQLSARTS